MVSDDWKPDCYGKYRRLGDRDCDDCEFSGSCTVDSVRMHLDTAPKGAEAKLIDRLQAKMSARGDSEEDVLC